jgi:hypothetical protein
MVKGLYRILSPPGECCNACASCAVYLYNTSVGQSQSNTYILNKCKYTCDIVKLELLESQCLPILLYGLESLDIKLPQLKEVNSWWNSVYRKLFGYNKWESVKNVICLLGRLDIHHLVNLRRIMFIKRVSLSSNSVMRGLYNQLSTSSELYSMEALYNNKVCWSAAKIKAMTYKSFKSVCSANWSTICMLYWLFV